MPYVTASSASRIEDWNESRFCEWLYHGLSSYALLGDRHAFDPLAAYIEVEGHITADLQAIYQVLPTNTQESFCAGVVLAFERFDPSSKEKYLLYDYLVLLQLANGTNAFDALISKIEKMGRSKQLMMNFAPALVRISRGAEPITHVVSGLRKTIQHPNFPESMCGIYLQKLMELSPSSVAEHLELLGPALISTYGQENKYSKIARMRLIRSLCKDGDVVIKHLIKATEGVEDMRWLHDPLLLE